MLAKGKYEDKVRQHLFDPRAATFSNTRIVRLKTKEGSEITDLCGEINGKDLSGGYVGFQYFYYMISNNQSEAKPKLPEPEAVGTFVLIPKEDKCVWFAIIKEHCQFTPDLSDRTLGGFFPDVDHTCSNYPSIGPGY